MSAMILSATACSGKTEISEPDSQQENEVTTEAESETSHTSANETQEQTAESAITSEADAASAETAAATEEAAVPLEQLKVMSDYGIGGGSWYFEADNGDYYFYDIAGNTLTKIEDDWSLSGIVFKTGDLAGCFTNDDGYSRIVDTKTKEYVLNGETDGCIVRDVISKSGRILVTKIDDSASNPVVLLGVMNNKGEWEYPLTELSSDELSAFTLKDCSYFLMGDHVLIKNSAEGYWYSLKDNKLSKIEDHDFSKSRINNDGDKVVTLEDTGAWVFDSTGTSTQITEHADDIKLLDGGILTIGKTGVYSWNDYSDMGFDLSEYEYPEIIDVTENTIAFCAYTPDGTSYTYIMNKDGSLVTEPSEGYYNNRSACFCGDYFVMGKAVINCKTGEVSTLNDDAVGTASAYIVNGIYSNPGVIVMRSSLTGNCFLVFPDDPETLINPFESAAQ